MAGAPTFDIRWEDVRGLHKFQKQILALNEKFPKVLPRIVNQVGDRAKTRVVRALTKQTGLKRGVILKAVENTNRAFSGRLTYDLRSRGGNVRLKYLNPRETDAGVVATPFGKKTLYPRTFMRAGTFPDRKTVSKWDGHVMFRNRSSGRHYTFARSGVFIPKEMIEGMTKQAFETEVNTTLPIRVDQVLRKLMG